MYRKTRNGKEFSPFKAVISEIEFCNMLNDALIREDGGDARDRDDAEGVPLAYPTNCGPREETKRKRSTSPVTAARGGGAESKGLTVAGTQTSDGSTGTCAIRPRKAQISQCPPVSVGGPAIEKLRNKAAAKARRQRKRSQPASNPARAASVQKPATYICQRHPLPSSIAADLRAEDLPAAREGGYIGQRQGSDRTTPWTLPELLAMGFTLHEWNGIDPCVFVDDGDRVIAALVGRPQRADWSSVIAGATAAMASARLAGERAGGFSSRDTNHRRGKFVAFATGVSFGGGQQAPGTLLQSAATQAALDILMADPNVKRVAGFQSSAFSFYSPKIYSYYDSNLQALFSNSCDNLKRPFSNSVFPAATFNLGPDTVTLSHTDHLNVAHGQCLISSFGSYDPKKGGHLILWDIRRVIEFPPGSTIMLPSSVMCHGNTPISPGETRMSMTQYCAGGLIRWVRYGFRSATSLLAGANGKAKRLELDGPGDTRWRWALGQFSKLEELEYDRKNVFHVDY